MIATQRKLLSTSAYATTSSFQCLKKTGPFFRTSKCLSASCFAAARLLANRKIALILGCACRNGAYFADKDVFLVYGEEAIADTHVAAKHFDYEFNPYTDTPWREIPTPELDRILDFQGLPPEVKDWFYILLGRLLYQVNDLDGWQVIPFLKVRKRSLLSAMSTAALAGYSSCCLVAGRRRQRKVYAH